MKESPEKMVYKIVDILRGANIQDYKKVIFPLLALRNLEDHVGKYEVPTNARWSDITSEYYELKGRILDALYEVEHANKELKGILISEVLEELDSDIYRYIVPAVSQIKLEHEVIEEILYTFAANEGKLGGDFITPKPLTKLIPSVLDVRGGKIQDGAAGVSQLLIATGEYAKKQGNPVQLYGQEINRSTWAIGKINLLLHGFDNQNFALGNTITEPAFANESFDYVVMNFPFSLKDWGREQVEFDLYGRFPYGIPSDANADMAFIQHALSALSPNGKAAILVPHGTLFRGGADRKIREGMISDDVIESIIGLPSNLFFGTGIPVALLILNKNKPAERKGLIQFIDASENYEKGRGQNILRDEDIQKIIEAYRSNQPMEQFSTFISIDEIIIEAEANLNIRRYFEVNEVESEILGTVQVNRDLYEKSPHQKVKLNDLVELYRGMNTPSKKELNKETGDGYLIQLADIQNGEILFDQLTTIHLDKKTSGYEVKEGDILLSSRGTAIKVAVVPAIDKKLILSHNFIGLRPRKGINPYFIKAFLESPIGLYYITSQQKGTAVTVLTIKDIENLPVPDLGEEQVNEIGNAFLRADKELENIIKKAKQEHARNYYSLYKKMGLIEAFRVEDNQ
jgi:type I restriction enzyme M protein